MKRRNKKKEPPVFETIFVARRTNVSRICPVQYTTRITRDFIWYYLNRTRRVRITRNPFRTSLPAQWRDASYQNRRLLPLYRSGLLFAREFHFRKHGRQCARTMYARGTCRPFGEMASTSRTTIVAVSFRRKLAVLEIAISAFLARTTFRVNISITIFRPNILLLCITRAR